MMKSFHVFGQDLKSALKKPKVFIPILVVLFIPVLYSGLFLNAFWDPYGKMNELPVAVVNTDQGAVYNDKSLEVGQNLIDELKKAMISTGNSSLVNKQIKAWKTINII